MEGSRGDVTYNLDNPVERNYFLQQTLGKPKCRELIREYFNTNGDLKDQVDFLVEGSLEKVLDKSNPNSF